MEDVVKHDWAKLFPLPPKKTATNVQQSPFDEDEWDSVWLTPKMACKLFIYAIELRDLILDDPDAQEYDLPPCARPFLRKRTWMESYAECFARIAARLSRGMEPSPNCTGEEMAVHRITSYANDCGFSTSLEDYETFISKLPSHPNDDDYDAVADLAVEDDDVLMLFHEEDDDDEDLDAFAVDDDDDHFEEKPKSFNKAFAEALDENDDPCNLLPTHWFEAFRLENFKNHIGGPVQR